MAAAERTHFVGCGRLGISFDTPMAERVAAGDEENGLCLVGSVGERLHADGTRLLYGIQECSSSRSDQIRHVGAVVVSVVGWEGWVGVEFGFHLCGDAGGEGVEEIGLGELVVHNIQGG